MAHFFLHDVHVISKGHNFRLCVQRACSTRSMPIYFKFEVIFPKKDINGRSYMDQIMKLCCALDPIDDIYLFGNNCSYLATIYFDVCIMLCVFLGSRVSLFVIGLGILCFCCVYMLIYVAHVDICSTCQNGSIL